MGTLWPGHTQKLWSLELSGGQCLKHQNLCDFFCPETNSSHLKINGWKIYFLLKQSLLRGHVSFRWRLSKQAFQVEVFVSLSPLEPCSSVNDHKFDMFQVDTSGQFKSDLSRGHPKSSTVLESYPDWPWFEFVHPKTRFIQHQIFVVRNEGHF